jgi:hypothetical protein
MFGRTVKKGGYFVFTSGCPRIHKIVQRIWFTVNFESKGNGGTGMLTKEEEREKKKKNNKIMALWCVECLS